jgi:ABC-type Fe3+-hydroxamate transport system substrate-binding protein
MQRIVSLVPSQTELLFHLGLDAEVVGITKFCIHPDSWFKTKTRIGGTKTIDVEKIKSLQPTLILANKEENVKEQVEALEAFADVYVSDISNLPEALTMITDVGRLVGKIEQPNEIIDNIRIEFDSLKNIINQNANHQQLKTGYLVWRDPYIAAGGDTFISDMMQRCGFQNMFADVSRYPEVTIEQLLANECELLILSSEPYPFKQKHIDELQGKLPATKIILADGEMFSWYGSRLIQSPAYFQQLRQQIFQ